MKRKLLIVLLIIATVGTLAGCGKTDVGSDNDSDIKTANSLVYTGYVDNGGNIEYYYDRDTNIMYMLSYRKAITPMYINAEGDLLTYNEWLSWREQ